MFIYTQVTCVNVVIKIFIEKKHPITIYTHYRPFICDPEKKWIRKEMNTMQSASKMF